MATVRTTFVSEYVLETARAMLPAGDLDKRVLKLERDAAKLEERLRRIEGSGAKAGAGLKKTAAGAKQAEGGARGLVARLKNLRGALAGVAAIAVGAFLFKAAEAWNDQERAVGQVEARLRSTGNVIGLTVQEIRSYASGIQKLTGVNDDLLLSQASILLSFKNITREAFPNALKAALDLSIGLGTDLRSAVVQVAKALDDPIRGLAALRESGTIFSVEQERVIKSLVDTGRAGEAQMLILRELDTQYGGSAEAARQAGIPFAALGAEFGDILEEVGGLLASGGLKSLVETLISGARATKEWLGELRAYFTEIDRGEELLRKYRDSTREAAQAQDELTESFKRTSEQIIAQQRFQEILNEIETLRAARSSLLTGGGRGALADAEWEQAFAEEDRKKVEEYDAALDKAEKSLADFVAGLRTAASEGNVGEFLGLKGAADALREVNPELQQLGGLLGEVGRLETEAKIDQLTDAWTELLGAQAPHRDVLRELARQFVETEAAEKAATAATKEAAAAAKKAAEEEKKRLEQRKQEIAAFHELAIAAKTYRDATGTGAIAPIVPAMPFHDSSAALGQAATDFENRLLGTVEVYRTKFGDANKKALRAASHQFREDLGFIAFDFGQTLADQFHTGPVHDAAFGLFQSVAQSGGAAIATALGGDPATGAALGGIFSSLLKGLFSRGSDEAYAKLAAVDNQLSVVATTIEGKLQPALEDLSDNIIQSVNTILAEFGGTLLSGEFGVKIRRGGEDVVRAYWSGVVTEFETEAEAASFLVAKILSTSLISGLGESVRETLEGGDFASADELLESLRFAEGIDNALRTPIGQFLSSVARDTRILLATAADLGISIDRVVQAERVRIQVLVDEAAELVRSVGGVQSFLGEWEALQRAIEIAGPRGVAKLEEQLLGAANAALAQASAAGRSREAFEQSREGFESFLTGLGISDARIAKLGERFEEMAAAGAPAEEIVQDLVTSIEGLSRGEVQQAIRNFRQSFIVDLFGQLATLAETAGKGKLAEELRAKALALSTRMQLLSIRATLEAARASGLLSDEQVRSFNAIIRSIRDGIQELGGFGALGRQQGGRGRGGAGASGALDVRTREEALADFQRLMLEASDAINGVTSEERQRLNVLAQLNADLEAGVLRTEEYRQAIESLDAVMAAAAVRAQQEITDRWAEIGASIGESPLGAQLRRFAEQAAEDLAAGGEGIPTVFAAQVKDWFREALENADTADERRELAQAFRDFVAGLPPELRQALRGSGIGRAIADGIAEAVASENIAAMIERVMAATAESGILFPEVGAGAGAGLRGSGRSSSASSAGQAADELARLREELQGIIDSSRRSELGPLNRQLAEIFDRFARAGSILKTLNAAGEQWNETAQQMAVELGSFWDSALSSVRDLLGEIRGSREAPVDTFTQARATFQGLTANLPADLTQLDPDELKKIVEAAREFRAAGTGLFGEGFGSGIVDQQLEDLLAAIEASAPTEEDLVLQALELLREQTVLELERANEALGSGGPIAVAVTDSSASSVAATDLQLVELARITGSLAGTISVLDELSPDQVAELRNTVERLLALEYLSEEQRNELRALQTVLDNQEIIDTLTGTLSVADTLSRDELTHVISLLGGTLAVADQLAPSQVAELRSIVAGLLGLENLSDEQRAALVAAQATLGSIDAGTADVKTGIDGANTETAKVKTAVDLMASEVVASNRALNKLTNIVDRLGAGDLNDSARRVLNKLDTVIAGLGAGSPVTNRLDTIASRLGDGNVNAKLTSIDVTMKAIRNGLGFGFGTAG